MSKPNSDQILVIEDDPALAHIIKMLLRRKKYDVTYVADGRSALHKIDNNEFELVLVDIGLPEVDGLTFTKELRKKWPGIPVVIITDQVEIENEILGFNAGANLFHRKPINFELLLVQIQSLVKREQANKTIELGDILFELDQRTIGRGNESIHLTRGEFELISLLITSNGKVFSREYIINRITKSHSLTSNASVDTMVSRLRQKLSKLQLNNFIETIHGSGYRLNLDYVQSDF